MKAAAANDDDDNDSHNDDGDDSDDGGGGQVFMVFEDVSQFRLDFLHSIFCAMPSFTQTSVQPTPLVGPSVSQSQTGRQFGQSHFGCRFIVYENYYFAVSHKISALRRSQFSTKYKLRWNAQKLCAQRDWEGMRDRTEFSLSVNDNFLVIEKWIPITLATWLRTYDAFYVRTVATWDSHQDACVSLCVLGGAGESMWHSDVGRMVCMSKLN